jgi:two-component system phosphate regulon response regulator OmpR
MTDPAHILVVDDDTRLRALLRKYLGDHGYMVAEAADAAEARQRLAGLAFDMIVLDVMMPGENGIDLTRSLRQSTQVPILLLTAMGEAENRVAGLESGADDYLVKPFDPRELLLRIGSILRRAPREVAEPVRPVTFGAFAFDLERSELTRNGAVIHLTTAEAQLLQILARDVNRALSREDLGQKTGNSANLRAIDVQMTRLRKKLEEDPRFPRYLQTVRGLGYMLRSN